MHFETLFPDPVCTYPVCTLWIKHDNHPPVSHNVQLHSRNSSEMIANFCQIRYLMDGWWYGCCIFLFQAVAFGLYIMPLNFMWEKLWGVHQSPYLVRVLVRFPVVLLLWFLALAFPFFGPLNSLIGSPFMSFSTFIIPSIAYIITFWTPKARQVHYAKLSTFSLF